MTEEELIQGCRDNKRLCQEALYRKYSRKIYGICLRYAQSEPEAEDMMQESFIKIFTRIQQYRPTGSFEGWIRRISVNHAIEVYRKNKRLVFVDSYERWEENPYDSSVFEKIGASEIAGLIQQLPEGYRMIFNLFAVEEYTHKDIAEMLGITEGTSKSQFFRAKAHLVKMLDKQLNIKREDTHVKS